MLNIMEIERFATKDGPGIRTVVFLKGCPLHCPWCANPESQRPEPQLLFFASHCVGCGGCVVACPQAARKLEAGKTVADASRCAVCGRCAAICPQNALKLSGQETEEEIILAEVLRDRDYYDASGGGLTVSGGEPLRQAAGVKRLFTLAKEAGIATAVETCGVFRTEALDELSGLVDLFLFDVKSGNPEKLKRVTGADLELVKCNLRKAVETAKDVIARVPVIPGFNHDEVSIREILTEIREAGVSKVDFLPYHTLGKHKYAALSREYPMGEQKMLTKDDLELWRKMAKEYGIAVMENG